MIKEYFKEHQINECSHFVSIDYILCGSCYNWKVRRRGWFAPYVSYRSSHNRSWHSEVEILLLDPQTAFFGCSLFMQLGLNCQITVIIIINITYLQPLSSTQNHVLHWDSVFFLVQISLPRQGGPDIWPLDVPLVTVISLSDKHATSRSHCYRRLNISLVKCCGRTRKP